MECIYIYIYTYEVEESKNMLPRRYSNRPNRSYSSIITYIWFFESVSFMLLDISWDGIVHP